jgi:hypothetical protein
MHASVNELVKKLIVNFVRDQERFGAIHDCPVLMVRALTAMLSALSKSALASR